MANVLNSEDHPFAVNRKSTKNSKVKKKNICEICQKSFSTKFYLKLHVRTTHDEFKKHKCDICGKAFGEKRD